MENMKKCPACAEQVLAEAKKCKHCGEKLPVVLPRFVRIMILIPFVFFGLLIAMAGVIAFFQGPQPTKPAEEERASVSPKRWKTHEDTLRAGTQVVLLKMLNNDISGLYFFAVKQKEIENSNICALDGCTEYRGLMRTVERATGDGALTPAEVNDVTQEARLVKQALDEGAAKIRHVAVQETLKK